jgi:hypothetical protein
MKLRRRTLDQIERLIAYGFPPVALCRPTEGGRCSASWHGVCGKNAGKCPLMSGWPQFAYEADASVLERGFGRASPVNVGVVCGAGLVAVEADSPEAAEELRALCGDILDRTPSRAARPGRGPAWFFESSAEIGNRAKLGTSGAIDFRGRGGLLVVDGVHWSGQVVRWSLAPWETTGVALLPRELRRIVVANTLPSDPPRISRCTHVGSVSPRLAMLMRRPRVRALCEGRGKRAGDVSASGYDFSLALALMNAGATPDEVEIALKARPGAHRRDDLYVATTMSRAVVYATRMWRRR